MFEIILETYGKTYILNYYYIYGYTLSFLNLNQKMCCSLINVFIDRKLSKHYSRYERHFTL